MRHTKRIRIVIYSILMSGLLAMDTASMQALMSLPVARAVERIEPDSTVLRSRLDQVLALFDDRLPQDSLFSSDFLAHVSLRDVHGIVKQFAADYGNPTGVISEVERKGNSSAKYRVNLSRSYALPISISIQENKPHLINGLFFETPVTISTTLNNVVHEFAAKYQKVSVQISRIDNDTLVPVAQLNPNEELRIASAFKLYVLAETIRQIEAGKIAWDDVVKLDSAGMSLPSGILQAWPVGAPITVHSLAALMISVSDNTATDHLLHLLGRANVESVQRVTGHSAPEKNSPFLTTAEMFRLRDSVMKLPVSEQSHTGSEWVASAADLSRTLLWLKKQTADGKTKIARDILGINRGVPLSLRTQWNFVGYKGGSLPGVMSFNFLLQHSKSGDWYTVSFTANNPKQAILLAEAVPIVHRAIELLGTGPSL